MTPEVEAIFQPLHEAFLEQKHEMADILDMLAGFSDDPHTSRIATALSLHARDILREDATFIERPPHLLSEMYRRTFFDVDTARVYGSSSLCEEGGEKMLKEFVDYLLLGFLADERQQASGFPSMVAAQH
jgi:hypothetical protein